MGKDTKERTRIAGIKRDKNEKRDLLLEKDDPGCMVFAKVCTINVKNIEETTASIGFGNIHE